MGREMKTSAVKGDTISTIELLEKEVDSLSKELMDEKESQQQKRREWSLTE
jgi:hypothetical protein